MGEESAERQRGRDRRAAHRAPDQGDIFLVGGACSPSGRTSSSCSPAAAGRWKGAPISVWARPEKGGGAITRLGRRLPGARSARACRGARHASPMPGSAPVLSDRSRRRAGTRRLPVAAGQFADDAQGGGRPVRSAFSAARPASLGPTREERDWLAGLMAAGAIDTVRATPNMLGACGRGDLPVDGGARRAGAVEEAFYRSVDETGFEPPATTAPEAIVVTCWGIVAGRGHGTGRCRLA